MMKNIFILLLFAFVSSESFCQDVYTIKADSVKVTNDSGNTELIIENSTRNIPGYLFNKGNGRTEFREILNPGEDGVGKAAWTSGGQNNIVTKDSAHWIGLNNNDTLVFRTWNGFSGLLSYHTNDTNFGYDGMNSFFYEGYTGSSNTNIGEAGQYMNKAGSMNTSGGYASLFNNNAVGNTAWGVNSLRGNIRGVYSVGIGLNAGSTWEGDFEGLYYSTFVGSKAAPVDSWPASDDMYYSMALGFGAKVTKSYQTVIGSPETQETIIRGKTYAKMVPVIDVPQIIPTTISINPDTTDLYVINGLDKSITIANPTHDPKEGQRFIMRIKDNGTSQSIAFDPVFRGIGGYELPKVTIPDTPLYLEFAYNASDFSWDLAPTYGSLITDQNTKFGFESGFNNETGIGNTYMGVSTGYSAISASHRTAFGERALYKSLDNDNSASGFLSNSELINGTGNTSVGSQSGASYPYPGVVALEHTTFLGFKSGATVNNLYNSMALGANVTVNKSNQIKIGNDEVAETYLAGNVYARIVPRDTITNNVTTATLNLDLDNCFVIASLANDLVISNPIGTPNNFQEVIYRIQSNGLPHALSFGTMFRFSSDLTAPTTTVAGKMMYIFGYYNSSDDTIDVTRVSNFN